MLVAVLIGIKTMVLPESNFRVRKPAKSVNSTIDNAELADTSVSGKCRDFTRAIQEYWIKTKSKLHDLDCGRGVTNSYDFDDHRCTANRYAIWAFGSG